MNCSKSLSLLLLVLLTTHGTVAQDLNLLKLVSDTVIHISEKSSVVMVMFEIEEGFHIQSNEPESESVIPTEIEMDWPRGVTSLEPIFPAADELLLEGTEESLHVFSGRVKVAIALEYGDNVLLGAYQIPGKIRYQACDHKRCFYPRELRFNIDLLVE